MRRYYLLFLFLILILFNNYSQIKINYPNINGLGKTTFSYAALVLALENSGVAFEIVLRDYNVSDSSFRQMLHQGKIDVADFGTSKEFENDFLPIYIPIDYGLNGWRLFIIHNDNIEKFSNVDTLQDLQNYVAGQGLEWSDVKILRRANIEVTEAPKLDQLFGMIEKKRFDFLPLGAHSIFWHLKSHIDEYPNLVIEDNIVLIYPFSRFFFVHKDNKELHDVIKKGLIQSLDNGSFLNLFKNHANTKDLFLRAKINNRKQIHIDNHLMSDEFKKIPEKYFFSISFLD